MNPSMNSAVRELQLVHRHRPTCTRFEKLSIFRASFFCLQKSESAVLCLSACPLSSTGSIRRNLCGRYQSRILGQVTGSILLITLAINARISTRVQLVTSARYVIIPQISHFTEVFRVELDRDQSFQRKREMHLLKQI